MEDVVRVAVVSPFDVVQAGLAAILARSVAPIDIVDVVPQDGHLASLDVVLYDLSALDNRDDADLRHLVRGNCAVIGLEPPHRDGSPARYRDAGVATVIPLNARGTDIVGAVLAAAGRVGGVAGLPSDPVRSGFDWPDCLTGRERQVLAGIKDGQSNQEIADQHFLTANTVKTYVKSAYRKIGVTSRSQAVGWYFAHGGK